MQKILYYCDQCKKQVQKGNDLQSLIVGITEYTVHTSTVAKKINLSICHSCCLKVGLIRAIPNENEKIDYVENVKDKLFNAIVEVIKKIGEI